MHYITFHSITLHYTTLHYITYLPTYTYVHKYKTQETTPPTRRERWKLSFQSILAIKKHSHIYIYESAAFLSSFGQKLSSWKLHDIVKGRSPHKKVINLTSLDDVIKDFQSQPPDGGGEGWWSTELLEMLDGHTAKLQHNCRIVNAKVRLTLKEDLKVQPQNVGDLSQAQTISSIADATSWDEFQWHFWNCATSKSYK